MDLKVGQSIKISEVMENYAHKGEKYITKIECYGKARHKENAKVLQGFYKDNSKTEDSENTDSKKVADDAGKDDMSAYTDEIKKLDDDKKAKNIASQTQKVSIEKQSQNININTQNTESANLDSKDNQTQDSMNTPPKTDTPQSQGIPPQIMLPPQEETLAPNWREERDKFNPPLLKEMPR